MSTNRRPSRFVIVAIFALVAAVSGSILTVTTGASPRFGFIDSVHKDVPDELQMETKIAPAAAGMTVPAPPPGAIQSGNPALQYTPVLGWRNGGFPVFGWSFTTNQAITVNALGALAPGANSTVRLYNGSGTVLASTIVTSADPAYGSPVSFRSRAITPIRLTASTTYYIVQDDTSFGLHLQVRGITTIPSISYGSMIDSGTPGANPTTDELFGGAYSPGAFGPNFNTPAPAISKSFGALTIPLGGTTNLTFEITNPDPFAAMTGVSFTDTMPAGLTASLSGFQVNGNCSGITTTGTTSTQAVRSHASDGLFLA